MDSAALPVPRLPSARDSVDTVDPGYTEPGYGLAEAASWLHTARAAALIDDLDAATHRRDPATRPAAGPGLRRAPAQPRHRPQAAGPRRTRAPRPPPEHAPIGP